MLTDGEGNSTPAKEGSQKSNVWVTCVSILSSSKQGGGLVEVEVRVAGSVQMIGFVPHGGGRGGVDGRGGGGGGGGGVGGRVWLVKQL